MCPGREHPGDPVSPDDSEPADSRQHVINIMNDGFTVSNEFSDSDRDNIFETGKLLNIGLKHLIMDIEAVSRENSASPTKEQLTEKTKSCLY